MKKKITLLGILFAAIQLTVPGWLLAAAPGAADLVVVADTRIVTNPILHYFANVYNTSHIMMAVWAVVLTAAYGAFLGFLMDLIMSRTGLDLKSRKIVEH